MATVIVTVLDEGTGESRELGRYHLPMSRCVCEDARRRQLKNWGKARGSGIPICRTCRRPSPAWREGLMKRLEMALGRRMEA